MLKPLQSEPLTFWHVAGDILYLGTKRPITREQAEGLRDIYADEAAAAAEAEDRRAAKHASKLWCQLTDALDSLDMYRRFSAVSNRRAA